MSGVVLVTGAGGFIGGALVAKLRAAGASLRAVDLKQPEQWYRRFDDVDNRVLDLRRGERCMEAADGASQIYQLAADMGGMGFIETHKAECMISVLINTNMLIAAREHGAKRYFYSSSACVYNVGKQSSYDVSPLKEEDAYPAMPEDGYGWEKLFSERMCQQFAVDYGLPTRVARFHNVYGPHGTWDGGREKAPAAICRKVIAAKHTGTREIEIWGDGNQVRSFTYIGDCLHGIDLLLTSDVDEPINLGSAETVTINGLVDLAEEIAGISLERRYKLDAPKGVDGRSSDNTMIRARLGWEPSTPLREGLALTYAWIEEQYLARDAGRAFLA